jgi:hypothetical protein
MPETRTPASRRDAAQSETGRQADQQPQAKPTPDARQDREFFTDAAEAAPQETGPGPERGERRKRVPVGVPRQKLTANVPPGYVGHWFNDDGERIHDALAGGYRFLSSGGQQSQDIGSAISRIVGTKAAGGQMTAYLMVIREEWWQEDQRAKASRPGGPDDIDETILAGTVGELEKRNKPTGAKIIYGRGRL